ncbi:MAG: hypothetical protein U0350_47300 [Caldilineaceae bacterium]
MNSDHMIVNFSPNFSFNLSPSAVRGFLLFVFAFCCIRPRDAFPQRLLFCFVMLLGADQFFFNGAWIWANREAILHETGDILSAIIEALITCLKGIEMVIGH